jgi:alanine-glyoxylate transaminase/(R)-3-amino-2-methylpropionate-pyruvate transaminase
VVHFTNSGAEAIDLAMAMARTYTGNLDILSLRTAYHGPTAAAQSVTGIANWRHPGMPGNVAFVADPNQYRGIFGPGTEPYLDEIDRSIATSTTGQVAAMLIESIQEYGGIIEMPEGYMRGAAERVRAAGGLLIADEVKTGFGRTGDHMWGFEADGVIPDIVVLAKGIGNGFPLGAVVVQKHIAETMAERFLFHTYGANPTNCAAARTARKPKSLIRKKHLSYLSIVDSRASSCQSPVLTNPVCAWCRLRVCRWLMLGRLLKRLMQHFPWLDRVGRNRINCFLLSIS